MNTLITSTNWNYCHFKSAKVKAQITYGAQWLEEQAKELYYITVTDFDDVEVFQETFESFARAQVEIHQRYGHWEFVDLTKVAKGEGCDSCSAH